MARTDGSLGGDDASGDPGSDSEGDAARDTREPATKEPPDVDPEAPDAARMVVGIGASAGGLDAFGELLNALPGDTGMAFVLIQHLDPRHASALAGRLGQRTA
jgi:chemotaxis response regulator CheB